MPREFFASRRRVVPLFVLLVVGSSCAKGKDAPDSANAAGRAPQLVAKAAGVNGRDLPGALPKPIEQYTADEFLGFARGLSFGGGVERPRKCKNDPACEAKGGKLTAARVDAVVGQDSLRIGAVPANGVVAVRARNTGAYVESRYGMLPGPFEYYLVVYPGAGDSASWRMQQVDTTAGARVMTQVASGTYRACSHKFTKLEFRANFYSCDNSHLAGDTVVRMGLQISGTEAFAADPIWMSCAHGCCVAM